MTDWTYTQRSVVALSIITKTRNNLKAHQLVNVANGILLNNKQVWTTDAWKRGESEKHYAKSKKLNTKVQDLYDSIYMAFGKSKLEGEIWLVVARDWGSEEDINYRKSTRNFLYILEMICILIVVVVICLHICQNLSNCISKNDKIYCTYILF